MARKKLQLARSVHYEDCQYQCVIFRTDEVNALLGHTRSVHYEDCQYQCVIFRIDEVNALLGHTRSVCGC